jgi:hypothetical protein
LIGYTIVVELTMACAQFNPNLPHKTPEDQETWMAAFRVNFVTDACVQRCANVCAMKPFTNRCLNCLNASRCANEAGCVGCLGLDPDFNKQWMCTENGQLNWWQILIVVIAGLIGLVGIIVIMIHWLHYWNALPDGFQHYLDRKQAKGLQKHDVEPGKQHHSTHFKHKHGQF